jgi:predicted transcriptional regulator
VDEMVEILASRDESIWSIHYLSLDRFACSLDESKEVFAYISGWRAIKIINFEKEISGQDSPFVTAINRRDKDSLRRYELIEETVKTTDSNENILEKMMKSRLNALIVTYPDGMLKGVVQREQVLSELMLALIESHSQSK